MKHRLFTILSALSLLLAVMVTGLWARSYWSADFCVLPCGKNISVIIGSMNGELSFFVPPNKKPFNIGSMEADKSTMIDFCIWHFAGFGWHSPEYYSLYGGLSTGVVVPTWFPLLIFLIAPSFAIKYRWQKRTGRCSTCGYDLSASKDKCPECGAVIVKTVS